MHSRFCLQLADRIHAVMLRELGAGVDRHRMLKDERYARDVLLVCDGLHDTPAPLLAHHFRRAVELPEEVRPEDKAALAARVVQQLFGKTALVREPAPTLG